MRNSSVLANKCAIPFLNKPDLKNTPVLGAKTSRSDLLVWRLAVGWKPLGGRPAIRGSGWDWRSAVLIGPPGGRGTFCLAALGLRQAMILLLMTCVCCVLSNDAILGSGDVVP